jgi:hypothetical protein
MGWFAGFSRCPPPPGINCSHDRLAPLMHVYMLDGDTLLTTLATVAVERFQESRIGPRRFDSLGKQLCLKLRRLLRKHRTTKAFHGSVVNGDHLGR